jgi:hypothetical protein
MLQRKTYSLKIKHFYVWYPHMLNSNWRKISSVKWVWMLLRGADLYHVQKTNFVLSRDKYIKTRHFCNLAFSLVIFILLQPSSAKWKDFLQPDGLSSRTLQVKGIWLLVNVPVSKQRLLSTKFEVIERMNNQIISGCTAGMNLILSYTHRWKDQLKQMIFELAREPN